MIKGELVPRHWIQTCGHNCILDLMIKAIINITHKDKLI